MIESSNPHCMKSGLLSGLFRALLLAICVLLMASSASAAESTRLDIIYKTNSAGPLKLDLHYPTPTTAGTRYPLVIFTHGGGWSAGNKTIGTNGVRFLGVHALNERGFCVASVDYRLCSKDGTVTIRDCVTDAKDALRFLAKHAEMYSLDVDHVFTLGDSAGGHLAQMLLLTPPEAFPGDPDLRDAVYHLVAGVSWYGPCDFEKIELFNPTGEPGFPDRFGSRIVRQDVGAEAKLAAYREVSPVNYLRADSPPLLMLQGDMDPTIPVHHAYYMQTRAEQVHAPVEILIVKNSAHNWREAGGTLEPTLDEIMRRTAQFMKQYLDKP